mgnify:CR=1 FL=1
MNKNDIIRVLHHHKDLILEKYNAKIIGIFGSFARGEENENSDVDLIFEFLDGATFFDLVELKEFLETELNRTVDVVSNSAIKEELKEYINNDLVAV